MHGHSEGIDIQSRSDLFISVELWACKGKSPPWSALPLLARLSPQVGIGLSKIDQPQEQSPAKYQVARLEIAMHYPPAVQEEQPLGSLLQQQDQMVHRDRMLLEVVLQGEVLLPHRQEAGLVPFGIDEKGGDIGMRSPPSAQEGNDL